MILTTKPPAVQPGVKQAPKLAVLIAVNDTTIGSSDPDVQRRKRAEIAGRYRRKRKPFVFAEKRVEELIRLARTRYGDTLPDSDEGRHFVFVIAVHLIEPRRIVLWLDEAASWYDEADELIARIARKRYRYRAAKVGRFLNVTYAEKTRLELDTIAAIDTPPEVIAATQAHRRARQREQGRRWRQRERRRQGMKPRERYEAESASRTKPWEAFGIKRRAWERRGKPVPNDASVSIPILTSKRNDRLASSSRKPRRSHPATPRAMLDGQRMRHRRQAVGEALMPLAPVICLAASAPTMLIARSCNADDADRRLATAIMLRSSTGLCHETGRACS